MTYFKRTRGINPKVKIDKAGRKHCVVETVDPELQILHVPKGALYFFTGKLAQDIDRLSRSLDCTPSDTLALLTSRIQA